MATHDTIKPVAIPLHPGFRGFVAGVVNADERQRAFIDVRDENDEQLASATFEGVGTRVEMKNRFDNRPHWSFGPFTFKATAFVKIWHFEGNLRKESVMVGPISINKKPEPDYPIEFFKTTVISEDGVDTDHDDCTMLVLEYK